MTTQQDSGRGRGMKWLIGCECSGAIRRAMRALGIEAYSCDIKPSEDGGEHIQDDLRVAMRFGWDGMIAHPDCTFLTVANNGPMKNGCSRYTPEQAQAWREEAVQFFMDCWNAPIDAVSLENPVGIMSTRFRKPDQIIQPWQFGDDASKATCLWLRGLPPLRHTNVLPGGRAARRANQTPSGQNRLGPSDTRKADRARTYPGIANAMAEQWGRKQVSS